MLAPAFVRCCRALLFECVLRDVLTNETIGPFVDEMLRARDARSLARLANADVSLVSNMDELFRDRDLRGVNLASWNTHWVSTMSDMFRGAVFDHPIGLAHWNTRRVQSMASMFRDAYAFNEPIGAWNVAAVQTMAHMFCCAYAFNQALNAWNTASVRNMAFMFRDARAFNQPIGQWNTAAVTSMHGMFYRARQFRQSLHSWDVSHVYSIAWMFYGARSVVAIGPWTVPSVSDMTFVVSYRYAGVLDLRELRDSVVCKYRLLRNHCAGRAIHAMLHVLARIRFAVASSLTRDPTRQHAALVLLLADSFETPWLLEMCVPAETMPRIVRHRRATQCNAEAV